jgi:hypothetical protein
MEIGGAIGTSGIGMPVECVCGFTEDCAFEFAFELELEVAVGLFPDENDPIERLAIGDVATVPAPDPA